MKRAPDVSLPVPGPADPGSLEAAAALAARTAGVTTGTPEPGDPPGTVARFAWRLPGRPWLATGTIGRRGDTLEVWALQLTPVPGPDGQPAPLSAAVLRAVKLTDITAGAQAALQLTARTAADLAAALQAPPPADLSDGTRPAGQGRPPLPASLLRLTAEAYLAEAPAGPGLYDRLADHLETIGGRPVNVRNAIRRAEEAGWLGPGARGKAQRLPGPRLTAEREQETAPNGH